MGLFGRKKEDAVGESVVEEEVVPTLPPGPPLNADGLRSVGDHREYLLSLVEPLRPFGMSVLEAWNQVMCEDVISLINVPPNSTSKIDGYAVRAADLIDEDGNLREFITLGEDLERLPALTAVVVGVGQVLPRGANAVLPVTFATLQDGKLYLIDRVQTGDYMRAAGEHLAAGSLLLGEGDVLDDRAIGMLASAGIDKVLVRPRPRVVIVSSGSDLVEPGSQVAHGETTDANSFMIAAAARAVGATVFRVPVHSADPAELRSAITDQLIRADLLISTTSGRREDYELVASAMSDLGLVDSVNVAMSPGRTQTFGLVGDEQVPMVMLPGNPVSAYVSFQVFVWPLIRRLMGAQVKRRTVRAIAAESLRSVPGQLHLLRGQVSSDSHVRAVQRITDPYPLFELARSNALILLDEQTELIRAGAPVQCWMLDEE